LLKRASAAAELKAKKAEELVAAEQMRAEAEQKAVNALDAKLQAERQKAEEAEARAKADEAHAELLRMQEAADRAARVAQETEYIAEKIALEKAIEQAELQQKMAEATVKKSRDVSELFAFNNNVLRMRRKQWNYSMRNWM
jgi:TATA-binding protein-associated factor Taf7